MATMAELLAQAESKKESSKDKKESGPKRFIPKVDIKVQAPTKPIVQPENSLPDWAYIKNEQGQDIVLDADQQKAVEKAIAGESFVLLGKAGTGKTTTMQAINLALLQHHSHRIHETEYRIKGVGTLVPGISIGVVAFANRAANNIRNKCQSHPDLKPIMNYNITTLHNMLRYSVEFYDDPETGKTKRRYFPTMDEINKLDLTHLEVEEGSMVPVGDGSIWDQMYKALPNDVQVIILGDPNQIPPVGGKPLIAYGMRDLPIVELKTVHRQALDNPIIRQALNCLEGKEIQQDYNKEQDQGVRVIDPRLAKPALKNKKIAAHQFHDCLTLILKKSYQLEKYDPVQDIVLCPNNKHCETIVNTHDINATIATMLARKFERLVYEIKAGFNTVYLAVGDKVMVDKYEGIVTKISHNGNYIGSYPKPASYSMTYTGTVLHDDDDDGEYEDEELEMGSNENYTYESLDVDEQILTAEESAEQEKTRAASHLVDIELEDGTTVILSSAGDFGQQNFSLGYAISIHKAQGSEWRNVLIALHESQGSRSLLYRELLYTALTRAKNRVDIIAAPKTIQKAVDNPRMKGNTVADKLEFFASGYLDLEVPIVPPTHD